MCVEKEKYRGSDHMKKWKNDWKSPEYNAWIHMIHRCTNEHDKAFKNYGGRGISVCPRWINSFDDFVLDMGPRPGKGFSLDRIDTNKGYEPQNCRWSDRVEQANNKRANRRIDFFGEMLTAREISQKTGVPFRTVRSRLDRKMTAEQVASTEHHIRQEWEHGTIYGYIKFKCRCDLCKQAKSDYSRAAYSAKKKIVDQII
jgi:hypothetical protein